MQVDRFGLRENDEDLVFCSYRTLPTGNDVFFPMDPRMS